MEHSSSLGAQRKKRFTFSPVSFRKKRLIIISLLFIVIIAMFFVVNSNKTSGTALGATDNKLAVAKPVAQQTLNKSFTFDVKDDKGKVITSFSYKIKSVELDDEIVINGQKYHPVAGKTFLVINLDITNSYTQLIAIPPTNYIRVLLDKSSEKLAPDIFTDPLKIQPISTKPTRLALAIATDVKKITLQVGEITGDKVTIPLAIHY